ESCGNGRLGDGDGTRGLRGLDVRRTHPRLVGRGRGETLPRARLQQLPRLERPGPRTFARRALWLDRAPGGRGHRRRRRQLLARVYSQPAGQNRGRLQGRYARLPGAGERRAAPGIDRLYPVPGAASGGFRTTRRGCGKPSAGSCNKETPMSSPATAPALRRETYLNVSFGVKSWLLTTDHKRIALLYLVSITLFFFLGGFFAVLIRLHLLTPEGSLATAETYNKLFTMHGVVMIFFFLIPSIPAVLGNFLIPLMIGAKDLAFPRLNLASWYIFNLAALFTLYTVITGGVDTG